MAARRLAATNTSLPASRSKKAVKCARHICKRRSRDPKADGWIWIETEGSGPLKTGWRCPECVAEFERLMRRLGVQPVIEPLS
jgi:hypothetical protein